MSILGKKYLATDHPNKFIKLSLSFNRETIHWATSQPKEVGYCVTATPVERTVKPGYTMESQGAFTGFYEIVYPIGRKSAKRETEAWRLIDFNTPRYKKHFINQGVVFINEKQTV